MLLQLNNVSANYGQRQVLSSINLEIGRGEIVGLIGPNGSGKSTLMKALVGLIPSCGEISYGRQPLSSISVKQLSRHVAYVAQERDVAWDLTVERVLALGCEAVGGSVRTPKYKEQRKQIIKSLSLETIRKSSILQVSGGEKTRALLGRALMQKTPLIVADEPTAGLDPEHQLELSEIFQNLREQGTSMLVSLHDWTYAARLCTTLVMLKDGKVVACGTPEQVLTQERVQDVYRVSAQIVKTEQGPIITPAARL
ncbi:Hemin import ATP-binding protein HmuV [Pseudovibrio axinellae]|uniref:Hemin import ATP-binding protein HmuV n=1 Tax=Pseudovibrio axinellae TaxID=989403 RepID=A0A161V3N4_9HYPH|nr:ABC transporter ATP-binding protein [Pseudovibrio axinellae]KZL12542.1 Hemin import ATP-binding protein HmuV [Pseudovibrio axinellae]SEP67722.1 iron complex transport system ATP-binding protein [Pseudovibrio axinellae]